MDNIQFKDVAHLYLRCDVKILKSGYTCVHKHSMHVGDIGQLTPLMLGFYLSSAVDVKPILRPLSDMTEDEAEEFALMVLNSKYATQGFVVIESDELQVEVVPNDDGLMLDDDVQLYIGVYVRCFNGGILLRKNGSISLEDDNGDQQDAIDDIAEKILFLLKKGFDLFHLIESNQAIQKQ